MNKLIRITTVPVSLKILLQGQHKFMSENGFKVIGVSSSGPFLLDVQNDENIEVRVVEMTRVISPFADLKALWQFYKLCKKEKPAIVHSHTPKAGIIGMLGAYLAGVPNRFHTVAGLPLLETRGVKRQILNFVERITYKFATRVYPNSKNLELIILENMFCKSEKLKVLANGSSNGINTEHFSPTIFSGYSNDLLKKKIGIKADDFVFVFAGRLVSNKGVNELIDAFTNLNRRIKKIKLLLVGSFETDLDPLSEESLRNILYNKNIVHVGFQKDVRQYFAISQVLIFPSYREGFPNVVLQAGSMGLPSIVSNINGCNEIIIDNFNGIIIPVKNTAAIVESMEKLIEDTTFYRRLSENSRTRITENYEQITIWKALLNEYKSLQ